MWPGDSSAPRFFVKATCSAFQPELEVSERKGRMRALRVEPWPDHWPKHITGNNRIRGRFFWELENASRKDGDNQQQETLTAQTLRGAGRAGAVREMQTRRAQPRTWRIRKKRNRQKSSPTPTRSGASCTMTAKMTHGQAWARGQQSWARA